MQAEDGSEKMTRHGSLKISENGVLQTHSGLTVMGDAGPITIPPEVTIAIAKDGTVSSIPMGTKPNAVQVLGRLKLVNPPEANIVRDADGLFKTKDGVAPVADAAVSVAGGMLEGSNVNVVESMVTMINLARQFEMQMKLLSNAESNATKASQILALS